ncbi:hypothetical protein SEMRO_3669_G350110.1 [Seminavis robusta]|uniref:Uncharacterized protein n=1 Tax=Seminavis robusta TaxID=568900 RepID=A0A9N8I0C0_9STRA|nr:hypothetical protein SEMRO_3669_G350110.1 [Seminavis robusta]|eukprot:Sro3669_g350110.1 n/a (242) ;mRNA; f:836-1561
MQVLPIEILRHASEPFHIDDTTSLPVTGLDNPLLAGQALAYWDITNRKLVGQFHMQAMPFSIVDNTTTFGAFYNPGAWARMVVIPKSNALVVTFFDLEQHSLFVTYCNSLSSVNSPCGPPRLVDAHAYNGDFTDFGAGGFPELQLGWNGCPVLVYFVQSSPQKGCLRVMQCLDVLCVQFRVFDVSGGLAGHGRDASVTFPSRGTAIVSFLDLQGHDDDPSFMQARVAVFDVRQNLDMKYNS